MKVYKSGNNSIREEPLLIGWWYEPEQVVNQVINRILCPKKNMNKWLNFLIQNWSGVMMPLLDKTMPLRKMIQKTAAKKRKNQPPVMITLEKGFIVSTSITWIKIWYYFEVIFVGRPVFVNEFKQLYEDKYWLQNIDKRDKYWLQDIDYIKQNHPLADQVKQVAQQTDFYEILIIKCRTFLLLNQCN